MVYTLGSVVNSVQSEFPAVRLSTLVEHLDSLIRTHAPLMKDRRCGSFLWSLLPTRFTPVYRSNYSKLTSSLARMTSSLPVEYSTQFRLEVRLHSMRKTILKNWTKQLF
ncbi:hypothetical protein CQW23_03474 [Capsicum baccatum]|uniref:Uncharacterized protein n=3 Tax=Capsicum TaxID=4071 RepID=A0A075VTK4_CAPAN|nr:hypothetical protein [Capsicum annuum]PHT54988.1 hypothetical protein CQW23_03474 [Capsicum baccatum]QFV19637.1 hypothetical protein [Capsicum annuum var. glabriusculum]AIG89830.1 hypothetical protein [Capsicum annuum]AIG90148.1 hypothetical protein [Capsicum annuum]PHT61635.1 hypothetical protein T459_34509 [Capsicum annuum]